MRAASIPAADQEGLGRFRPLLGELHVEVALAVVGGVSGDLDPQRRIILEDLDRPLERGEGRRVDDRRPLAIGDPGDDAGELGHRGRHDIRAAVLILISVLGLGVVGALVGRVGDPVLVVVQIGAAVVVLEAVLVLGLVRALVARAKDAVAVFIFLRAAVIVVDAVLGLGLVGALVDGVGDPVLVVVQIGAAVVVLEAVLVLGLVRALVLGVDDPVAVAILGRRRRWWRRWQERRRGRGAWARPA